MRPSEKEYRSILNELLVGVVVHANDTSILLSNPAAASILGLTCEQMTGKRANDPAWNFVHADSTIMNVEDYPVNKVLSTQKPLGDYEVGINRPDRDYTTWTIVNAIPIFSNGRTLDKVIVNVIDITERKQTDEALRESEAQLSAIAEAANDAIVMMNSDGDIIFWNSAAERIFGYRQEEVLGRNLHMLLAPERYHADFQKNFALFQATGEGPAIGKTLELQGRRKDGIIKPIELALSKVKMQDGWHAIGIVRDITGRKQAEETIRRSESMQRKMVANIGDVIAIIDRDGVNRYNSPNIEKLFGWKIEDVVGGSTWELVHPEDLKSTQTYFRTLMQEPKAVGTTEFRYKCKDGSYRWIEFTGSNLSQDPDIGGLLGNYHDITDRKQAEQSLRESEARFKALHNASFGGIAIHDKGIILDCNQGLSEMSGYRVAELIGMDGLLLIAEQSRHAVMHNIITGYEKPYEALCLRKDGTEFPIRIEARNVPYKGKDVRTVEFRDITENKRIEEEKANFQNKLVQGQKMEAIGTLAGGIAHDFNNILSAIIGYTELLQMKLSGNSKEFDYAQQIRIAGARARDLIKQILTFSRQSEHEIRPVDLATIAKEISKLLRSSLPTTIEIRQGIQGNALVMGDPTQLHQILMNLCTNAGHAMQDKGGLLTIELKNIQVEDDLVIDNINLTPGNYVQLSVSDTGHGIPAEHLERIFDPFFTTKERGEGTGMGLSVVHGIVESCKGAIHVDSEAGIGSTFKIFLPAIERPARRVIHEAADIPKGNEHLLFVDDDPALIRMGTTQLESLGYKVSSRSNSIEALALFKNKPDTFDLVITDMTMPKMTGDALATEIKRIKPSIPIILCTGFSLKISQENIHKFDIDAFLLKPIIIGEMAETIRNVLDKKR
jgi:PAS domain S-box-containing protein